MAKFTSHYQALGFYANGQLKRFSNGQYVTEDKDEIVVLSGMADVEVVVEEQKTEAKPAPKAPARKASAK